ncbi:alkaline phosphatase PhoX [Methylobacter sp. G7]|uniref:alkaline phosphatase PhoX n=1 Tax=Methylobacter sp. G7 TaxID=3230117 RepID=UPI003D80576C
MDQFKKKAIITGILLACAQTASAGTDVFFNPLTQSAAVAQTPNHVNELNSPWQVPAGVSYENLTSLHEIEADPSQSTVRVPGLGAGASMTDMSAFDPSGRYIFLPHETQYGAGLTRYDRETDKAVNLFRGDMGGQTGNWTNDFGALDPATWTPANTLLVGEEWSGQGRLFEVTNPMANVENGEAVIVNELHSIPNVSHEGLRFNHDGSALYFVDEDRSGSVYKFVPSVHGDYSKGQSFVLRVNGYTGGSSANAGAYPNNNPSERSGSATWVAMTDIKGVTLTTADPFDNETRGGRAAADELNGTPFRRPEDVEIGYLKNGHEVLYFTATEELAAYSVEELGHGKAMVRLFADESTLKNLGQASTTGHINSPDNLAQDALGNIYMVEDAPNGDNVGGDIWFLRDTNNDGIAESVDHFMSLQVKGAENTGMIFNPANPTQFIINVQHPESTADQDNGMGDATWLIDINNVVAPLCAADSDDKREHARNDHDGKNRTVKTCNDSDATNFIKKLTKASQ